MRALKILVLISSILLSNFIMAATPTCHSGSGGYCRYTGKVERIYVNSGNLILLYFDSRVPLDVPASIGFNATQNAAASFNIDANPEFAKLLYSTALAAQASGRVVTIQMNGVQSGYLKIDRIWLGAP